MTNRRRRATGTVAAALIMALVATGCTPSGGATEDRATSASGPPARVVIGVGHALTSAPQMIYGKQTGLLRRRFPETTFVVQATSGSGENPMTDLKSFTEAMTQAKYDFVFADISALLQVMNYGGAKSPPPPYVVIAGATARNRVLMGRPGVSSLKQLAGKTVGIYNKAHDTEMLLNALLAKQGLKTASLGGTVKVEYGPHDVVLRDFKQGKIDAFYIHVSDYRSLLKQGAKVLDDGSGSQVGGNTPFTVLAVRKDFLDKHPAFVKEFVAAHVDSGELVAKDMTRFLALAYEYYGQSHPRESLEARYSGHGIASTVATANPNLDYLQATYRFLADAKYTRLLPPFAEVVNVSILNDVLKSKGLEQVSQAK